MKWTDELDGEFNGNPCKIRVGVSETKSCHGDVLVELVNGLGE